MKPCPYSSRLNDFSEYQGDWDARVYPGMGGWVRTEEWRPEKSGPRTDMWVMASINKLITARRLIGGYARADATRDRPAAYVGRFVYDLRRFGLMQPGCLLPALDLEPTGNEEADAKVSWPTWATSMLDAWNILTHQAPVLIYSSASYFDSLFGGVGWLTSNVNIWAAGSIKWAPPNPATGKPYTDPEDYAGKIIVKGLDPDRILAHQYRTASMPGLVASSGTVGEIDVNAVTTDWIDRLLIRKPVAP